MKRWQHFTWKCLVGVIAAVLLLLATAAGLFRLFVPLVPGYRAEAQAWASAALGRPVEIAAMGARLGLHGPELTLKQVAILSRDRRYVVIEAREVRLGFTLGALLHGQFSHPSLIILMQPQLVLERETDGSFNVRGLEGSLSLGAEHTNWREAAAEAFAQNAAVRVRNGQVTVIDMRAPGAPLVFDNISLNLDNSADSHRLSARMQLPAALGRSLSFDTRVQGAGLQPETWQWQAQLQGSGLNLPGLLAYWPEYRGRFNNGHLDLRATLSGEGASLTQAQATLATRELVPAGAPGSGFDLIAGTFNWNRAAAGWDLDGSDIRVQRPQDRWPVSRVELQYRKSDGLASWSGGTNFARLRDLAALSTWLPVALAKDTARLQKLSPGGDLSEVKFSAQRNGSALGNWSLSGRFTDLGVHADGDIPGFSGLSGTLAADQDGGTLALSGANATVTFPHLFRGPLAATALTADVQFHHEAQGWLFTLRNFTAANQDVRHAEAQGTLLLPADGSLPVIDLQASVENADAKNKSVYFPVGIMPKEVVAWLDSAIVGGQVPSGSLVLRGKLADFPYDKSQGLFDIRFHLLHGELDYAGDWPPVKDLDAEVEFKNQGMSVSVQHGTLLGDEIGGATARFADLRNGLLHIQGTVRGGARAALEFLRSGPIKQRFGHVLDGLSAAGGTDVSLDLRLPVEHPERYKLDGSARVRNASLTLAGFPQWPVSALNGTVRISEQGVSAGGVKGMFLGEPLSIGLQADGARDATLVTMDGGAAATSLAAALPAPFAKAVSGNAAWRLTGSVPNNPAESSGGLSLTLESGLQGLGLALPTPFAKPADDAVPLHAALTLTGRELQLRLDYGKVMNGVYRFTDDNGAWKFDRGDLVFGGGQPTLPSAPGLMLGGTLAEFSLDDWKSFLPPSAGSAPPLPPVLLGAELTVGNFSGFDQHIENLGVQLARTADHWEIGLSSRPIAGSIAWPYHPDAAHPIAADMQRVMLVRKPSVGKAAAPSKLNPRDVPPLRLNIRQFRYNDATLDNLHAEFEPQPQGVILKTLSVTNPAFEIRADGRWTTQSDGGQQTILNARLQSSDVKQTLQAFGYAPGISGSKGELTAELNWPGGPLTDILPMLNGKLHVKLQNGSLLELKPGAGRIFGLLSINALPQHLLLNFSDVLGKGFAYNSIEGDFTIQNGDAYTSNLTVAGPAAKIQMVGRTGLAKHDFDEAVVVMPSVGSSLPVLSALAGGVGVGAVVFLLTEIFKKPLSQVGESRYRLTGTWDNPVLTRILPPKPASAAQP